MEANDVKKLKEREEENTKLKKMFAEVSLENQAMKELFTKSLGMAEKKTLRSITERRRVISH